MAYEPWKVQEDLWKEKCSWGNSQNKIFLARNMTERTGNSVLDTLRDLELAEQSGMLHTNEDGSVVIR